MGYQPYLKKTHCSIASVDVLHLSGVCCCQPAQGLSQHRLIVHQQQLDYVSQSLGCKSENSCLLSQKFSPNILEPICRRVCQQRVDGERKTLSHFASVATLPSDFQNARCEGVPFCDLVTDDVQVRRASFFLFYKFQGKKLRYKIFELILKS